MFEKTQKRSMQSATDEEFVQTINSLHDYQKKTSVELDNFAHKWLQLSSHEKCNIAVFVYCKH